MSNANDANAGSARNVSVPLHRIIAVDLPRASQRKKQRAFAFRNIVLVHGAWGGWFRLGKSVYDITRERPGYNVSIVQEPGNFRFKDDVAATKARSRSSRTGRAILCRAQLWGGP